MAHERRNTLGLMRRLNKLLSYAQKAMEEVEGNPFKNIDSRIKILTPTHVKILDYLRTSHDIGNESVQTLLLLSANELEALLSKEMLKILEELEANEWITSSKQEGYTYKNYKLNKTFINKMFEQTSTHSLLVPQQREMPPAVLMEVVNKNLPALPFQPINFLRVA